MRMIYNFFFRLHNSLLCSTAYNVIKTVERSFGVFIYDLIWIYIEKRNYDKTSTNRLNGSVLVEVVISV